METFEAYQKHLETMDERMRSLERVVNRLQGGTIFAGVVATLVMTLVITLGNHHLKSIWQQGIDVNRKQLAEDRVAFVKLSQDNLDLALKAVRDLSTRQNEALREILSGNAHRDKEIGRLVEMVVRQETNYEVFKRQAERMERMEMVLGEMRSDITHLRKELDRELAEKRNK